MLSCTLYEFQLKSICSTANSGFSDSYYFLTKGCCQAPSSINLLSANGNSLEIAWQHSSVVIDYNIKFKAVNQSSWTEWSSPVAYLFIPDLDACTEYEIQIQTNCNNNTTTPYSGSFFLETTSCDNCLEYSYCPITSGTTSPIWISRVAISDLDLSSGYVPEGFGDYTGYSATLHPGLFYPIQIETEYNGVQIPLYFQVWIDLDQDGIFGSEELLFESSSPTTTCGVNIYLPNNTLTGTTRMRIAARDSLSGPCGYDTFIGEVEDYCLVIVENTDCLPPLELSLTTETTQATASWLANFSTEQFEIQYRELSDTLWLSETTSLHWIGLENLKPCTDYMLRIRSVCNGENSNFSEPYPFRTLGCGTCLDLNYCIPQFGITDFEWIARFSIGGIQQTSGGEGYGDFTYSNAADFIHGNTYSFEIETGFANQNYEEYYQIWIDYNQDGIFDDLTEKVFQSISASTDTLITGSFQISATALQGATRLRVSISYYSPALSSCEDQIYYGEVEDYCVSIYSNLSTPCNEPVDMTLSSFSDTTAYILWAGLGEVLSFQFRYKALHEEDWTSFIKPNNYQWLSGLLPCTDYEYQVRGFCAQGISPFTNSHYFSTDCTATPSEEPNNTSTIILYPNPVIDDLHIYLNERINEQVDIHIYNCVGQLVYQRKAMAIPENNTILLDLKCLASDLYFLRVGDGVFKFVLMRD